MYNLSLCTEIKPVQEEIETIVSREKKSESGYGGMGGGMASYGAGAMSGGFGDFGGKSKSQGMAGKYGGTKY